MEQTRTQFDPEWIVIHCSATREGDSLSPSDLNRLHVQRGFRCCGYHYYVTTDGRVFSMRSLNEQGAHVKGYNHMAIGICYEGGLDRLGKPKDTRTLQQKRSITALIKSIQKEYFISRIVGHRDLSPDIDGDGTIEPNEWLKACPCFDAISEYKNLLL